MSLALVVALIVAVSLQAGEKSEVTLTGQVTCAHCQLHEGSKCQTVLLVKNGDQEVKYYFKEGGAKESYSEDVCSGRKDATVTGVVVEQDGKKWITPSKVEYARK
jgi:hypothetical protein